MATTTLLSISTLNVGGLNTPVKWNWVADWIKKKKNETRPFNMLPTQDTSGWKTDTD